MSQSQNRSIKEILRLGEKADLLHDPKYQKLAETAAATQNQSLRSSVGKLFGVKAVQHTFYPFRETHEPSQIQLGTTSRNNPIGVSPSDLTKHLLTVGQSGSGKTTLFYNIYEQITRPAWFFDLKQDYRHLTQNHENILVLPWNQFRFNPLKPPPGVPPRRWIQVFSEIFGHSTALLSGSKNYLMKSLINLYQQYQLFEQVSPPYPSLPELETETRRDKINYVRKTSNYRDTLLNRLEAMNRTAGTIFDCSQGHNLIELLNRDVVFEFDGLSRDVQNLLMETLFTYVYEYRVAQNQRDNGLKHVFFLDEGKRVFSVYKERQDASGIPEIDDLTAKMREFGEGLVVGDQEASKLTDSIKANTYTKVLLPTGDRKQFKAMTDSMNLSQKQMEYASQLGIGEAVIQVGNGHPHPVKFEDYEIEKSVTDEELKQYQQSEWNELSYQPRKSSPVYDEADEEANRGNEKEIVDDPTQDISVSELGDRLLKDVIEDPFRPLSQRYDRFSSSYKGNKAKNELVENGVVVEQKIRAGPDKRKLLELTEKGREYAENSLDLDTKQRGRGGIVHRYWQHRIQEMFEDADWAAKREMFDADVYANNGNIQLAVEVAMGNNPREIEHVEEHLEKFDAVWIACRDNEILKGLQQRIQENGVDQERIAFRLFRDVLTGETAPL